MTNQIWTLNVRLQDASISHRLSDGYVGKCNNLHGHTYHFEIELEANCLKAHGLIADFKSIKQIANQIIQDNYDHATLVYENDLTLIGYLTSSKAKYLLMDTNTTVENIAKLLYQELKEKLPLLKSIKVWETDDCSCKYQEV